MIYLSAITLAFFALLVTGTFRRSEWPPEFVVVVRNLYGTTVPYADVVFQDAHGKSLQARYDAESEWYWFDERLTVGTLIVSHREYERQVVDLDERSQSGSMVIYLGREGDSYTFVSGHRMPYVYEPNKFGVIAPKAVLPEIQEALKPYDVMVDASDPRLIVIHQDEAFDRTGSNVLRKLREISSIPVTGTIITSMPGGGVVQTHRFTIRFSSGTQDERVAKLIESEGLTIERRYRDGRVRVAADISVGDAINDIMERISHSDIVAEVEGEFVGYDDLAEDTP